MKEHFVLLPMPLLAFLAAIKALKTWQSLRFFPRVTDCTLLETVGSHKSLWTEASTAMNVSLLHCSIDVILVNLILTEHAPSHEGSQHPFHLVDFDMVLHLAHGIKDAENQVDVMIAPLALFNAYNHCLAFFIKNEDGGGRMVVMEKSIKPMLD